MKVDRSDLWSLVAIVVAGSAGIAAFGPQHFDEWTEATTTSTTITTAWEQAPADVTTEEVVRAPVVITANGQGSGVEPLIYVDGIRVEGMPDLTPDAIDRIEIVKGPGAIAAFGEEASVGVVQIFLKVEDPADPGR